METKPYCTTNFLGVNAKHGKTGWKGPYVWGLGWGEQQFLNNWNGLLWACFSFVTEEQIETARGTVKKIGLGELMYWTWVGTMRSWVRRWQSLCWRCLWMFMVCWWQVISRLISMLLSMWVREREWECIVVIYYNNNDNRVNNRLVIPWEKWSGRRGSISIWEKERSCETQQCFRWVQKW